MSNGRFDKVRTERLQSVAFVTTKVLVEIVELTKKTFLRQESIPVGCEPPACKRSIYYFYKGHYFWNTST